MTASLRHAGRGKRPRGPQWLFHPGLRATGRCRALAVGPATPPQLPRRRIQCAL